MTPSEIPSVNSPWALPPGWLTLVSVAPVGEGLWSLCFSVGVPQDPDPVPDWIVTFPETDRD